MFGMCQLTTNVTVRYERDDVAVHELQCAMLITPGAWAADKVIKMSTTTSTQASGLLEVLLPELEKDTLVIVNLSGRGDKDADFVAAHLGL